MRNLIRPEPGRALISLDWKSQEVMIGAVLSQDRALLADLGSDDLYMSFAVRAGLAPAGATKDTHPAVRDMAKTLVLATSYGMGWKRLAERTGMCEFEAKELLRRWATSYPVYEQWLGDAVRVSQLRGYLSSVFGFGLLVTDTTKPNTLRDYLCQCNGAEMLRLAAIYATEEAGIEVCAPLHDSLLVECDLDDVFAIRTATTVCMDEASRRVLAGAVVGVEATVFAAPDRYRDRRGDAMWARIQELLKSGDFGASLGGLVGSLASGASGASFKPLPLPAALNLIDDCQIRNQEAVPLNDENPCAARDISS
jgi:hypothetical protein